RTARSRRHDGVMIFRIHVEGIDKRTAGVAVDVDAIARSERSSAMSSGPATAGVRVDMDCIAIIACDIARQTGGGGITVAVREYLDAILAVRNDVAESGDRNVA